MTPQHGGKGLPCLNPTVATETLLREWAVGRRREDDRQHDRDPERIFQRCTLLLQESAQERAFGPNVDAKERRVAASDTATWSTKDEEYLLDTDHAGSWWARVAGQVSRAPF